MSLATSVFISFTFTVWYVCSAFIRFERNPILDDHVCTSSTNVFEIDGRCQNSQQCLYLCLQHVECAGVFYDTITHVCTGCKERTYAGLTAGGLVTASSTLFFSRQERSYHQSCSQDSACGYRQYCGSGNVCMCKPGYSYHSSSDSCVERCITYGDTYEVHPSLFINKVNLQKLANTTEEECQILCTAEPRCRTFDTFNDECMIQEVTALTHSDNIIKWIIIATHHHRNCA